MEKTNQDKIQDVMAEIISVFSSDNVPAKVSEAMFPFVNIPISRWSLGNRILAIFRGTSDARTFLQWKEIGRFPSKGSKAFYILAPCVYHVQKKDGDGKPVEGEKIPILKGFKTLPVFRIEDTEGSDLPKYENPPLPDFPLLKKAQEWNIPVSSVPNIGQKWFGMYRWKAIGASTEPGNMEEKILLASPDELVFLHEISHAAHNRIEVLSKCSKEYREIVAEFSAHVLARFCSVELPNRLGNAYEYIKSYSGGKEVGKACMEVLSTVEKVVKLVLE